jgi:SAM-dependent methyltransferase
MEQLDQHWYADWFDTPYYHILYKNRDHSEAKNFIKNLADHLQLPEDAEVLDIACGRGRHSVYLNKLGFKVTGIDLSLNNIEYARQFENDRLEFKVHDMCQPMPTTFDAVFNLFTSFGYFDTDEDNQKAIQAMKANMKHGACGVIDFMNCEREIQHLKPYNEIEVDDILFKITKWHDADHIYKKIDFTDESGEHRFTERVKILSLEDFKRFFMAADLQLINVFGDYHLTDLEGDASKRLILLFRK